MGQNILPCIVWKNTEEFEQLTQIPKPNRSTSLKYIHFISINILKYHISNTNLTTTCTHITLN